MNLVVAANEAGQDGVIAREAWHDQTVVLVRKFDIQDGQARTVMLSASASDMGNYDPSEEDLRATDWFVVSRSKRKFAS